MTLHQQKQIEIINHIEQQIESNSLQSTVVAPVEDYENDERICLTSVHFPTQSFVDTIYSQISTPLKVLFPEAYFYPPSSLHLTIKNIRVIRNPPHFSQHDIELSKELYAHIIPRHKTFAVYPYRLLLFKNNLALMNTTDEELDTLILDIDRGLIEKGIPDDKTYVNSRHFFCNMTVARFNKIPPQEFISKVTTLSATLKIPVYAIDSVSLISGNAVMKKLKIYGKWMLIH